MNQARDASPDSRIERGMQRQLNLRSEALSAGARHRGWKVGLTTPASRAAAGIDRSLIGFLTTATEVCDRDTVDIGGWTRPTIEAELAIEIGAPVAANADRDAAASAIRSVAVAIEVVSLTVPLHQVEEVLACDIFHRRFAVGKFSDQLSGGDITGITIEARIDGKLTARETAPAAVIGTLPSTVQLVARALVPHGLSLEPGDVIMAGSAIPLTPVGGGQRLEVTATGLESLGLAFTSIERAS